MKTMQILFLNKDFFSKNYKILFLLFILFLIFYRSPYIFLNGRFIAEEGSFWFRNAFLFGPVKGITQIFVGSGYFNFWANISSVLAIFLPLEYAPFATVYMAFLVQFYLFIFIIYSESTFLNNRIDKVIVSLIVLLTPPMVAEVWLNTLTSQVYFSLLVILIFFQREIINNFFTKTSPVILLISGLTSLIPCIFTPFFFYKYLKNKTKFNFFNILALSSATIFQSIVFVYVQINNLSLGGQSDRFIISFEKFINYNYNVLVKSFFGRDLTQTIFYKFFNIENLYFLTIIILFFFLFFFIFIYKKIKDDKVLFYLVLFFILQSLFVFYGAKSEQVQGRFALIPSILLIFSVYRFFQISSNSYLGKFCLLLIFFSLITGSYEYKTNNKYNHFLMCIDCPIWKEEINKWKKDKDYSIKIWDYPRKTMQLN